MLPFVKLLFLQLVGGFPFIVVVNAPNEASFVPGKKPDIIFSVDRNDRLPEGERPAPPTIATTTTTTAATTTPEAEIEAPPDQHAVIAVYTDMPELHRNQVGNQSNIWVNTWILNRILERSTIKRLRYHSTKTVRIPLRFRFYNSTDLSLQNGTTLMEEVVNSLENNDDLVEQVIGVIIETIPQKEPDAIWSQVIYELATNSFRLPVAIADSRGPTFTPLDNSFDSAEDEEACGRGSALYGNGMGFLLSTTPSQHELDHGLLEIIFAVVKGTPFAVIHIEDDESHAEHLSSTVEELLNIATWREQDVTLFRLKAPKITSGTEEFRTWRRIVKDVAERWRKFVIVSHEPALERIFIQTALSLGFAGRDYVYLTLNFDFHLTPLNLSCLLDEQTLVNSIRLRRLRVSYDKMSLIEADSNEEFHNIAVRTAIRTFRRTLGFPNATDDSPEEKRCSQYQTGYLSRSFNEKSQEWVMELLSMTNDGYFVRLQYVLPFRKLIWVLNPGFNTPISVDNMTALSGGMELQRFRRRTEPFTAIAGTKIIVKQNVPRPQSNNLFSCRRNRFLRITMILEPPFIMRKKAVRNNVRANSSQKGTATRSMIGRGLMLNAQNENSLNMSGGFANYRSGSENYEGYCIDLLEKLSQELGFTYELTIVPDGKYGSLTETSQWNGMIGELVKGNADAALAPLTITQSRSNVVDFTQSFMTLGIGLLYYKHHDSSLQDEDDAEQLGMYSFFRPLDSEVWLVSAFSIIGFSLAHLLLSKLSPVERNSPNNWAEAFDPPQPPGLRLPNPIWTLSNSIWLAVSTLMHQGNDFFPSSRSTKILYITWGFVSLLLCSCYTANLAAFLTTERLETPIRKVTDLTVQNRTKYGTLFGGSTHAFFKNSRIDLFRELYANMVRENTFLSSQVEGIQRILSTKGRFAFFLESTKIEYEVARECRLVQIGSLLDSKGYGIATQKGSPLRDMLSSAILKLQTEGVLQRLKNKWWFEDITNINSHCLDAADSMGSSEVRGATSQLSMKVLGGSFFLLIAGLVVGFLVCIIEFIFYGISKAMRNNGCRINVVTLLNTWRFHLKRVVAAGATKAVIPIVDREIY